MSSDAKSHKLDKMDLAYAAILGLTVIMSAWCGYQHELWGSALTFELKAANTAHREYSTAELKEKQSLIVDVVAFNGYLVAVSNHDQKLINYYENSFRPEMKTAFDVWFKTNPLNSTSGKNITPFDLPEYQLPSDNEKVLDFLQVADEKSQNADKMSGIASNYVYFTTMYASISFLEGIGRVFASKKMQLTFLIMGAVFFVIITAALFLTLPSYSTNISL